MALSHLVRLAVGNPSMRSVLVRFLKKARIQRVWKTPAGNWRGKDLSGDARSFGPGPEGKEKAEAFARGESVPQTDSRGEKVKVPQDLGTLLSGWHSSKQDPIYQVSSMARAGEEPSKGVVKDALKEVEGWLRQWDSLASRSGWTSDDKAELEQAQKKLKKVLKDTEPEEGSVEVDVIRRPTEEVQAVINRYDLKDSDLDQLKKWKKAKPRRGVPISMAEKKRRFLLYAKPETKERMKDMSLADFEVLYKSILTEDEDEGDISRTAAFEAQLVRFAYRNPQLRLTVASLFQRGAEDRNVPQYVKDLAEEITKFYQDKGDSEDTAKTKGYATAWSVYCKYKKPGSSHCEHPKDWYF